MVAAAQLVFFIACSLLSGWFFVRQYRAADQVQKRQMLVACVPAVALVVGLVAFAALR